MTTASWKILPDLVVRHAGFPFSMLDCLNLPDLGNALQHIADCEADIDAQRSELLSQYFPAAVRAMKGDAETLKLLSRLRSRVGRRKGLEKLAQEAATVKGPALVEELCHALNILAEHAEKLRLSDTAARELFVRYRPRVSAALRRTFAEDPMLNEAIWVSNPDMHARAFGKFVDLERPVKRSQERRFATYLHRFCAKNDTASFFGPMGYGNLFDDQVSGVEANLPDGKYVDRKVFPAFWLIEALASMAAKDPVLKPFLVCRPHPMLERSETGLRIGDRELSLPLAAVQIIQAAMQADTVLRDLATNPLQSAMIDQLVKRGLFTLSLPLPSTILDPMGWLRGYIERETAGMLAQRPKVLEVLDQIDLDLCAMQGGSLLARIQAARRLEQTAETQSLPTRRSAGGTYADRTLTYEECDGDSGLIRFSVDASEALQKRLEPTLNLMAAYGANLAQDVRSICTAAFDTLATGRSRMSYLAFIDGLNKLEQKGALVQSTKASTFAAALHKLAENRLCDGVVQLNAADVATLAGPDDGCGLYTSPDLMFAAANPEDVAGPDCLIVLGETHQFLATWGSQMMFHPQAETAHARAVELVEGIGLGDRLATILHRRVHKGLVHESFPGAFVEVSGDAGAQAARMAMRDLDVVRNDQGLFLEHRETGRAYGLYHSGDDKLHLWAFAPPRVSPAPIRLGLHTPRIVVGDVVYQRARWEIDTDTVAGFHQQHDEFNSMRDFRCLATKRGIPRRFFLRVASEKKPLFVDLDSPNACTIAHELLRSNGKGSVSEMLPDNDGLWLKDAADNAYCLELRTTCYRPGPAVWMPEIANG